MKILSTLLIIAYVMLSNSNAQISINKIAAYDSESSFTSGIYAINNSQIFRYSWYYQQWLSLPLTGLVQNSGTYVINNIAVYNNKWDNSSGIFVFSDTAIFNYNWISQTWYKLYNKGLPRNEQNKIDVLEMTVYGDSGASSNSELFILARTGIYRYSWYYQQWFALPNAGLPSETEFIKTADFDIQIIPNPTIDNAKLQLKVPVNAINNMLELAFISQSGQIAHTEKILVHSENFEYNIPLQHLVTGVYFCEVRIRDIYSTIKLVKIN